MTGLSVSAWMTLHTVVGDQSSGLECISAGHCLWGSSPLCLLLQIRCKSAVPRANDPILSFISATVEAPAQSVFRCFPDTSFFIYFYTAEVQLHSTSAGILIHPSNAATV